MDAKIMRKLDRLGLIYWPTKRSKIKMTQYGETTIRRYRQTFAEAVNQHMMKAKA